MNGNDWIGNTEDASLYNTWYKIYVHSGLPPKKIDNPNPNILIEIEDGLILEDGWENMLCIEELNDTEADSLGTNDTEEQSSINNESLLSVERNITNNNAENSKLESESVGGTLKVLQSNDECKFGISETMIIIESNTRTQNDEDKLNIPTNEICESN